VLFPNQPGSHLGCRPPLARPRLCKTSLFGCFVLQWQSCIELLIEWQRILQKQSSCSMLARPVRNKFYSRFCGARLVEESCMSWVSIHSNNLHCIRRARLTHIGPTKHTPSVLGGACPVQYSNDREETWWKVGILIDHRLGTTWTHPPQPCFFSYCCTSICFEETLWAWFCPPLATRCCCLRRREPRYTEKCCYWKC